MIDLARETTDFLHHKIPLTRAMGVAVESFDGAALVLAAPPEPNHNHLGTAFGGSLAALATLAGYGLLWLRLGDRDVHIVVRNSAIHYERPVRGTLRAICRSPDEATFEVFRQTLEKKGKARLLLRVTVEEAGEVCVNFEGMFVALK